MIKWAVSVVDTQYHAIDMGATHPSGVYMALCRHALLVALTSLEDSCPAPCVLCVAQFARRATRRE